MSSLFNTIRVALYGVVLLFTVICLAMAAHFQAVLAASDLTRFVPFAIFVCAASLFIFTILLVFGFLLRERNPISTRIELASLGLAGVFWLVLGVYLTTSESQNADVECFASETSQVVLDPEVASFRTEQYQAMYRVLNAFALMNAVLVIFACFTLLFLAIRRHRNGEKHMWHGPVTSCAWFNAYSKSGQGHRAKTSSSSVLPIAAAKTQPPSPTKEKSTPGPSPHRHHSSRREYASDKRHGSRSHAAPSTPPKKPVRHDSGRSGKSSSSTVPRSLMSEIDNGLMLHPNDLKRARQ
ncbi:hypothetical protein P691DRAFT_807080 [Macrolepiota fuliginosa MF-IS2]|uniref:MARVEL domain-containing protein n=1 Tax=Macrolepiota fuliginosa MF-IS2 TaxID=1400762 RepID=A0A9P5XJW4_9AGAR|nr:hypothetical protein P691DRAFT_807080 [Macrolepiota fuliginosa MF-IS2]